MLNVDIAASSIIGKLIKMFALDIGLMYEANMFNDTFNFASLSSTGHISSLLPDNHVSPNLVIIYS